MKVLVHIHLALALTGVPALIWAGDNAAEMTKLQGTWALVSLIDKGRAEPDKLVQTLKLIIDGDKYTYDIGGKMFNATFKLDAAAKPLAIDVKFDSGPAKDRVMKAIYVIEGDTLKICGADKRPTEFESTKESGTILFTFKREKK